MVLRYNSKIKKVNLFDHQENQNALSGLSNDNILISAFSMKNSERATRILINQGEVIFDIYFAYHKLKWKTNGLNDDFLFLEISFDNKITLKWHIESAVDIK